MVRSSRKTRKKAASGAAGTLLALFLVLLSAGSAGAWLVFTPYGPSTETFVEVAQGTPAARIGRQLESAGVLRSRYAFDLVRSFQRGTLRAGEYRFDHPENVLDVYDRIRRGDVYTKTVVVPEGANIFDVAARLEQAGFGPQQQFLDSAAREV